MKQVEEKFLCSSQVVHSVRDAISSQERLQENAYSTRDLQHEQPLYRYGADEPAQYLQGDGQIQRRPFHEEIAPTSVPPLRINTRRGGGVSRFTRLVAICERGL